VNPEDYLTEKPDIDDCSECGYSKEMVCDVFESATGNDVYWVICPRCDEVVFDGEVPTKNTADDATDEVVEAPDEGGEI